MVRRPQGLNSQIRCAWRPSLSRILLTHSLTSPFRNLSSSSSSSSSCHPLCIHLSLTMYSPVTHYVSDGGSDATESLVPDLWRFFSTSCYSGDEDGSNGFFSVYGKAFEQVLSLTICLSVTHYVFTPLPRAPLTCCTLF